MNKILKITAVILSIGGTFFVLFGLFIAIAAVVPGIIFALPMNIRILFFRLRQDIMTANMFLGF